MQHIAAAAAEFVEMVSSSANEISTQENKTVINPEHVVAALEQLGFVELKQAVSEHLQELKADTKGKRQSPCHAALSTRDTLQRIIERHLLTVQQRSKNRAGEGQEPSKLACRKKSRCAYVSTIISLAAERLSAC